MVSVAINNNTVMVGNSYLKWEPCLLLLPYPRLFLEWSRHWTKAWRVFAEWDRWMKDLGAWPFMSTPHTHRMAQWTHHHLPIIQPAPNFYQFQLGVRSTEFIDTNHRDHGVTEQSLEQTNKWQPRKEGYCFKNYFLSPQRTGTKQDCAGCLPCKNSHSRLV
jgi:hypothetical protein